MKYRIEYSTTFKRSYKLAKKRGLPMDELNGVVRTLAEGHKLSAKFHDHQLGGRYKGCRECHIQPDWLMTWEQNDTQLTLLFLQTGTHADLF